MKYRILNYFFILFLTSFFTACNADRNSQNVYYEDKTLEVGDVTPNSNDYITPADIEKIYDYNSLNWEDKLPETLPQELGWGGTGGEPFSLCQNSTKPSLHVYGLRSGSTKIGQGGTFEISVYCLSESSINISSTSDIHKMCRVSVVEDYSDNGVHKGKYNVTLVCKLSPELPYGKYEINVFDSSDNKYSTTFELTKNIEPVVIQYNRHYYLFGFSPNEEVFVAKYKKTEKPSVDLGFISYALLSVDSKGSAVIDVSDLDGKLIIVQKNGNFIGISGYYSSEPGFEYDVIDSCPGAPPFRLTPGHTARVCTIENLLLRTGPSTKYQVITKVAPNTIITILGGPTCDPPNNWSYWYVELSDGKRGWMSEGGDQTKDYFICPY